MACDCKQCSSSSSTSSFVTSIASEIKRGTVENGRVYAAYGNHGQAHPSDIDDSLTDRVEKNTDYPWTNTNSIGLT